MYPYTHIQPSLVLPDQNQRPTTPFPRNEHSREIAAHLTVFDFNLFTNIQQVCKTSIIGIFHLPVFSMCVQYNVLIWNADGACVQSIWDQQNREGDNQPWHPLKKIQWGGIENLFTRHNACRSGVSIFVQVHAWVITEMCQEEELTKRIALLQKFIKIAVQWVSAAVTIWFGKLHIQWWTHLFNGKLMFSLSSTPPSPLLSHNTHIHISPCSSPLSHNTPFTSPLPLLHNTLTRHTPPPPPFPTHPLQYPHTLTAVWGLRTSTLSMPFCLPWRALLLSADSN